MVSQNDTTDLLPLVDHFKCVVNILLAISFYIFPNLNGGDRNKYKCVVFSLKNRGLSLECCK